MTLNSKFIIRNYTNLEDIEVIELVKKVIELGRISETKRGKQYCFHTVMSNNIHIIAERNKSGSDVFILYKEEGNDGNIIKDKE